MDKHGITMRNSGLPGSDNKSSQYSAVTMSEQMVIQHLKHCRDLTRGFAYRFFSGFWRQWCKQVVEIAEQAKSNKEQVALDLILLWFSVDISTTSWLLCAQLVLIGGFVFKDGAT